MIAYICQNTWNLKKDEFLLYTSQTSINLILRKSQMLQSAQKIVEEKGVKNKE